MASNFKHFPPEIESLPDFDGPFDAYRLVASGCDVLFASYPGGTDIAAHNHPTNNVGVITKGQLKLTIGDDANTSTRAYEVGEWYHIPAEAKHSAVFDVDSAIIEFWFDNE